ncbi:sugar transferase [Candidatus Parcubacteria bacterium]|nr:sugar transferase [Candidatus Parcubacteria bacterium]
MFSNKLKTIILMGGDLLMLYFSLSLTLIIRYGISEAGELWGRHFAPFTAVYLIWIIVFYIIGLYENSKQKNLLSFYSLAAKAMAINSIIAIIFFYFISYSGISPKRILFINIVIFCLLFFLWRKLYSKAIYSSVALNNLLIIGTDSQSLKTINQIVKSPGFGYKLIGVVGNSSGELPAEIKFINSENLNLPDIIKKEKIQTIVNSDSENQLKITSELYKSLSCKVRILGLANFYEELNKKIHINLINEIWFLENLKEGEKKIYEFGKRIADIALACAGLILSFPFLPFLALVIKIDSKGPLFFTQIRTGKNGKKFLAVKLRTMAKDAEKDGPQFAKINDSRITRVGKFLRQSRIDEIPQLLNVLRGEMSFIGPRPERPEFISELEKKIPFYKQRLIIKPGLTGCDQISGAYHSASPQDSLEKLQYDLYYIKNRSFALDLDILLKTVNIILKRQGR